MGRYGRHGRRGGIRRRVLARKKEQHRHQRRFSRDTRSTESTGLPAGPCDEDRPLVQGSASEGSGQTEERPIRTAAGDTEGDETELPSAKRCSWEPSPIAKGRDGEPAPERSESRV